MKRDIPSQSRRILQDNKNQFNGNIAESFNLDLTSNRGKLGVTRTKKIADFTSSFSATQGITNINIANGLLFFFGVETGIDGIFEGGSTAFSSTFVRDSSSVDFSFPDSDVVINDGTVYASSSASVSYSDVSSFGTWTEISSPALDSSTPHLMTALGNRKYVSNLDYKIATIDSSNVLTLTGTGTCNFALDGYTITVLMSGLDRVWVGFSSTQSGQLGTTYIYEWDGESENQPSQRYEIDASGLIFGVIKDGIPYVLDTNGRLLKYAGSTFVEVARLPYKDGEFMAGFNTNQFNNRAIHPRAVTTDGDEILMNISNRIVSSSSTNLKWADFPSGVWGYSEENGIYHKLSASYQAVADSGTTNIQDYGQCRVLQSGGIFVHDSQVSIDESGEGGRIIFSQRYYVGSDDDIEPGDNDVTFKTALFANDTRNDTQKYGYFITPELHTEDIEDTWQKIYLKHKQLLDSADKIVVKYREEVKPKVTADITWLDIDRFTTTTDVSAFTQNQEVQIIQGFGSGKSFTISSISENAGTYTVILTETVDVLCYGKTAVAQFSNFLTVGETNYSDRSRIRSITIPSNNTSPMAQFKVCMQFTGEDELYGVKIISKSNIKE